MYDESKHDLIWVTYKNELKHFMVLVSSNESPWPYMSLHLIMVHSCIMYVGQISDPDDVVYISMKLATER